MNINGLNDKEVIESRKKHGTNQIIGKKNNTFVNLLLESLSDPIIKILLIALLVKTIFLFKDFDWFETLGILIAIFVSSFISTISEYGSEKAFDKLKEESSKLKCNVIRNSKVHEIYIEDLVVGDIIELFSGVMVGADAKIISGDISLDESTINGESSEVKKKENDKIYKGTTVINGYAKAVVESVGKNTYYGKIASELMLKKQESPLKLRLRKLAGVISTFGYVGSILASISYLFSLVIVKNNFNISLIIDTITNVKLMINYIIHALTLAVTIIIVSVPEGLPMMITLVLSSNMKKMIKDNVLVRKLVGIETAGSLNILFTDKTGTLTDGKLSVNKIIDGNLNEYESKEDLKNNNYKEILKVSMIVNNMCTYDGDNIIGGNVTDKSLLSFFDKTDYSNIKKIKTVPFNSNNKYMITVIDDNISKNLIKGAPEIIMKNCRYYYNEYGKKKIFTNKKRVEELIEENTKKGIRIIALATSNHITENLFKDLVFVGIVLIKDNVRHEAYDAIKIVKDAKIQTVMITGDNVNTAKEIATELNIITSKDDVVLTSLELNKLSDTELKKIIPKLKVVARSFPQDKSRLVRVCQEMDLVVGMTGDGVNDAPALKKADVGFGFGSGSEVAKEASDIVILDNNFKSICKAILYGRTIFKSIRKFIIFQLTINLCALSISIIGPFIGISSPVTVIQMLWINMVMDTLAALAFSFEPPLLEYMMQKPKKKKENIMNSYMYNEIVFTGLYTTAILILFLKLPLVKNFFSSDLSHITAFFGLFIFSGIFNCFNARTSRINFLSNILKNKMFIIIILFISIVQVLMIYYGGKTFRTSPLLLKEFILMIFLSITVIPFDILRKVLCKKNSKLFDV